MSVLIVCIAALLGSALTFFSGFGLGTLLAPVFALFFPIEVAIALTAMVHLLNNLFKLALIGKKAKISLVLSFGIPSLIAAFAGAYMLQHLAGYQPLLNYHIGEKIFYVTPVKLAIAVVLAGFTLLDIIPRLATLQFNQKYLVAGGLVSGFFGGLSGNQGALRSAFLIKAGLDKESFVATGVVIACLVDVARLSIYSNQILGTALRENSSLMIAATLSAFAGAFAGSKLLRKITLRALQVTVACCLLIFSILLGAGMI